MHTTQSDIIKCIFFLLINLVNVDVYMQTYKQVFKIMYILLCILNLSFKVFSCCRYHQLQLLKLTFRQPKRKKRNLMNPYLEPLQMFPGKLHLSVHQLLKVQICT